MKLPLFTPAGVKRGLGGDWGVTRARTQEKYEQNRISALIKPQYLAIKKRVFMIHLQLSSHSS
jgi:hypothetical protein